MPLKMRSRTDSGMTVSTESELSSSQSNRQGDSPSESRPEERKRRDSIKPGEKLDIDSFDQLAPLGEGSFGIVTLVRKKGNKQLYALKAMAKAKLIKHDAAQRVLFEAEAMQSVKHPFVMRMYGAFQDADTFYFILEFVSGGDLYGALERYNDVFPEDWCRIYIAEIAMALDAVHKLGYMYRCAAPHSVRSHGRCAYLLRAAARAPYPPIPASGI